MTSKISYKLLPTKYAIYGVAIAILLLVFSSGNTQQYAAEFLGIENFNTSKGRSLGAVDGIEEVKVKKVSDGDTITLTDGRRVRYLNIDTPESVKRGTPVECYALKASYKNKELVDGKTVYLTRDKSDKDRYGRDLAFVFLNKEDIYDLSKSVNAQLIKEGYARSMFYSPNTTYKAEFKAWEAQAQRNNVGLWQACPNLWQK